MTEIATIDWFKRWGTSVFSENTAILPFFFSFLFFFFFFFLRGMDGDKFQQGRTTKLVLLSAECCKSQYLTLSKT